MHTRHRLTASAALLALALTGCAGTDEGTPSESPATASDAQATAAQESAGGGAESTDPEQSAEESAEAGDADATQEASPSAAEAPTASEDGEEANAAGDVGPRSTAQGSLPTDGWPDLVAGLSSAQGAGMTASAQPMRLNTAMLAQTPDTSQMAGTDEACVQALDAFAAAAGPEAVEDGIAQSYAADAGTATPTALVVLTSTSSPRDFPALFDEVASACSDAEILAGGQEGTGEVRRTADGGTWAIQDAADPEHDAVTVSAETRGDHELLVLGLGLDRGTADEILAELAGRVEEGLGAGS